MPDNVFIFGAGVSFAAGIPLLGDFMDRIWQIARTGKSNGIKLTDEQQQILERAIEIRNSLRDYHAQVTFDQFNIEDILSILSFDALAGTNGGKKKLSDFTRAIALTIELSCGVFHNGDFKSRQQSGPECYREFWKLIFKALSSGLEEMPAIISFNYDLVLERALIQALTGPESGYSRYSSAFISDQISVKYGYLHCSELAYDVEYGEWNKTDRQRGMYREGGIYLDPTSENESSEKRLEIPLIKLHGSLNFPKKERDQNWSLVKALPDPAILPPVFNKATSQVGEPIWKAGLEALRGCKRLIICGYSLPTTDIYMQYFLKAALGPNDELNKILVFDPVLFREGQAGEELEKRYSMCFSPQFKKRIEFHPKSSGSSKVGSQGTFEHLVEMLKKPEELLHGSFEDKRQDR